MADSTTIAAPDYEAAPLAIYTCHTTGCICAGLRNALPAVPGLSFVCGGCGEPITDVVAAPKGTTPGTQEDPAAPAD